VHIEAGQISNLKFHSDRILSEFLLQEIPNLPGTFVLKELHLNIKIIPASKLIFGRVQNRETKQSEDCKKIESVT